MASEGSRSKKRSAASSLSKQPDVPVFFIDRSIGRKIVPHRLQEAGLSVEIHDNHFPIDARDERWLAEVGKRGWVVLTKDRRIKSRTVERMALMKAGVAAFILTAADLQGGEMATAFITALPRMTRLISQHPRPFIATVSKSGIVALLEESK